MQFYFNKNLFNRQEESNHERSKDLIEIKLKIKDISRSIARHNNTVHIVDQLYAVINQLEGIEKIYKAREIRKQSLDQTTRGNNSE
tara:strand:+ start:818 stop:1075 length:258 start_codon:yes stop_codon:yes gene_type:complete